MAKCSMCLSKLPGIGSISRTGVVVAANSQGTSSLANKHHRMKKMKG
jgi:hypothetical protein